MSSSNLAISLSTMTFTSSSNSVSKSDDLSNNSFSNVLDASKNNNSTGGIQRNIVDSNDDKNLITSTKQNNNETEETTGDDYNAELEKVESQIASIESGKEKADDDKTASLLLSLQQILNSILKNANASTSASTDGCGSVSSDLQSKLTDIQNILQDISKNLVDSEKQNGAQTNTDVSSQNALQNTNLADDITKISLDLNSLTQEGQNTSSQNINSDLKSKLNDIVECLNLTNRVLSSTKLSSTTNSGNQLIGKLKSEINNIIKNNSASTENESSYLSINSDTSSNSTVDNSNFKSSDSSSNSSSKENEFLNNLIGSKDNNESSDDKYSRVTNVINQLINNNTSTNKVEENQLAGAQIRSTNFAEDVVKNVTYMENNNVKDMTVTIAPKELGQVFINVSSENGILKASITVTNKEAYNLLNSNLGEINKNLSSQAVKLDNVEVNIYNGDTTFFKDDSDSNSEDNNQAQRHKISNVSGVESIEQSGLDDLTSLYDNSNVNLLA